MLYAEIVSIKDSYLFARVNDPTSEECGQRFFLHRDGVSPESLVSFDDCRLHDSVAFDLSDDNRGRGPKAVAAMISAREPGERFTGTVKNLRTDKGFAFVSVESEGKIKDYFCHALECEGFDLMETEPGVTMVSCELATNDSGKVGCIAVRLV